MEVATKRPKPGAKWRIFVTTFSICEQVIIFYHGFHFWIKNNSNLLKFDVMLYTLGGGEKLLFMWCNHVDIHTMWLRSISLNHGKTYLAKAWLNINWKNVIELCHLTLNTTSANFKNRIIVFYQQEVMLDLDPNLS
jgi:hypothetical protein